MPDDLTSSDQLKQISERLDYLEAVLREQLARLYAIEKYLKLEYQPGQIRAPDLEHTLPPDPARRRGDSQSAPREGTQNEALRPEHASVAPPPQSQRHEPLEGARSLSAAGTQGTETARAGQEAGFPRTPGSMDLETRIGGSWLLWIGVLATSFGVAFFLKLAFENDWIPPAGRIGIGALVGGGFLMGAERFRPRYPTYAHGLCGGGILILYLVVFAAFSRYGLIPHGVAFLLMWAITITAAVLAARYNALAIAMLGLIGGFLTPILLSTGHDNQAALFAYIALLDLGVLALAYSKQWRSLNYMAFSATVVMFTGWMATWYTPEKLWTTFFFLTLFFVVFGLLAILYNVVNQRPTSWLDLSMVFANGLLYFGASYALLEERNHAYLGLFAVLVAAFYLSLGYFTYRRDRSDILLVYTFVGLALLFLVLAVPIQLDQHWVTMGWAIEGAILTWVGLRVPDRTSRYAALIVFLIAVTHWVAVDINEFAFEAAGTFIPVLNRRALSCAVLVTALGASALFYRRFKEVVESRERDVFQGLYVLGANVLAVTVLTLDARDYFEQLRMRAGIGEQLDARKQLDRLHNSERVTLSVLWTLYGGVALFTGVVRRIKALQLASLLLLGLAAVHLAAIELDYHKSEWHTPVFNETFGAMLLLIVTLGACAWLYRRAEGLDEEEKRFLAGVLSGAAHTIGLLALSYEAIGYFEQAKERAAADLSGLENKKQMALSVIWAAYGATVLTIGVRGRVKLARWGGWFLIGMAALKCVIVDLRFYDATWHAMLFNETFAAFGAVVAALAWGERLYSQGEIDEHERANVGRLAAAGAHLLAIVALSAEASGYYARRATGVELTGSQYRDFQLARQLSLSVIWALYGGGMLMVGLLRRNRLLRLIALILLGLTILKVFLLDLAALERVYRIISFIVLGGMLLVVSFLYQRYGSRVLGLNPPREH